MNPRLALFNAADFIKKSRFSSLGLAYIASYIRKYSNFKDIHIIEGNGIRELKRLKPHIVGISSVTQTFKEAVALAEFIKRESKETIIILGGHHISSLPYTMPECFDIAVLGEGEETFAELIKTIAQYGNNSEKLYSIKGIAFHDGNRITTTEKRNLIKDIDYIPFPARDILKANPFSNVISSRGCPYKCIFCSSVNFWGAPRYHSAEYFISEIEEIIGKYKAVHISIWDDLFIANKTRLQEVADAINRKKINQKVSFGCALRSNLVTDDICKLLKKINITRVSIGFESGSQRILDYLKCGSVTVEQHIKAVDLCKKYGFYTTGTFMIGTPGENQQDLEKTLGLVKTLKLEGGGNISLTTPLPGTKLWSYARDNGLISNDADINRIGLMSADFSDPDNFKGIILTREISKKDFFKMAQKIQREANKYYIAGLFKLKNISFKTIIFVISRPIEFAYIVRFLIKSLFRRSSVMDRYAYYYKKMDN